MAWGSSRRSRLVAASAVLVGAALFLIGAIAYIAFNAQAPYTAMSGLGVCLVGGGAFVLRQAKQDVHLRVQGERCRAVMPR